MVDWVVRATAFRGAYHLNVRTCLPDRILDRLQIYRQHLSQQYPVLVLNLALPNCNNINFRRYDYSIDERDDLPRFYISRFQLYFRWLALAGFVIWIVGLIDLSRSICIT